MNRSDLQLLATLRLFEAKCLLNAKSWPGAYYLAGYAVECALKACIARQTKEFDFPDKEIVNKSYTHNLDKLLEVAGLVKARDDQAKLDANFAKFWSNVKDWNEDARYENSITETTARDLDAAIRDPKSGVFEWLKKWW